MPGTSFLRNEQSRTGLIIQPTGSGVKFAKKEIYPSFFHWLERLPADGRPSLQLEKTLLCTIIAFVYTTHILYNYQVSVKHHFLLIRLLFNPLAVIYLLLIVDLFFQLIQRRLCKFTPAYTECNRKGNTKRCDQKDKGGFYDHISDIQLA